MNYELVDLLNKPLKVTRSMDTKRFKNRKDLIPKIDKSHIRHEKKLRGMEDVTTHTHSYPVDRINTNEATLQVKFK